MNEVNFTDAENKIRDILDKRDHKDVEINRMWPSGQNVVVDLNHKKERGQIVIPVERFQDNRWLDIETKIDNLANQLKQKAVIKPKKKQKRDAQN